MKRPPARTRLEARRRSRAPSTVFSPCDIASRALPARVRVGGRVLAVEASTLLLADAITTLEVKLAGAPASPPAPGDLVVVEGRIAGSRLERASIVVRHPGRAAGPELSRFAMAGVGRRLAARALGLHVARAYFDAEGFVEVETPIRVASPGLDAHVDAVRCGDRYLVTSPEHHMKRLLVGGLPRIFQLGRVFREGELGRLHQPEFTMLEWYRAFSTLDHVVADTEAIVHTVVSALAGRPRVTLGQDTDAAMIVDVRPPFPRVTVREAFHEYAGVSDAADLAATDEDAYFQLLVDRVEPGLATSGRPVVLHRFPATQAALARRCADDPTVAERFELYVAGVELCNGYGELTDPTEQRARFETELERRKARGAPPQPIDEPFLAALSEGMPPSGGNALGFDRLIALATGDPAIAGVTAFPEPA